MHSPLRENGRSKAVRFGIKEKREERGRNIVFERMKIRWSRKRLERIEQ